MSRKLRRSYRIPVKTDEEIKRVAGEERISEAEVIEVWAEVSAGKERGEAKNKIDGDE